MMMKFTSISLSLLFFSFLSISQPVLQTTNIPDVGSDWTSRIISDTTIQPGPGGAGQVWNFFTYFISPVVIGEQYVSPAGSGNDLLFPNANLKVASLFGTDDYYIRSSSGLQYLGSKSNSLEIIISNVQNLLTVPLQFGDSIINPGVTGTGMQAYTLEGTVTVKADAAGDLLLANASFTNTLRVVSDINLIIGPNSGVDTYLRIIKYSWYNSIYKAPVFQIISMDMDGPLGFTKQKFALPSTLTSDINDIDIGILNLNVNPNPAKSKTTLILNLDRNSDVSIQIRDVTGRLWKEQKTKMFTGANRHVLDVANLPKGIYVLSAVTDKSKRHQRLIVD